MKRKVLLALVMAVVMLLSVVPSFAAAPEGKPVGTNDYRVTSPITSYLQLKDIPNFYNYDNVYLSGNIQTNNLQDFVSLYEGETYDSIPSITWSFVDDPVGEYPIKVLPIYGADGIGFPSGLHLNGASTNISQDFEWTGNLRYVYALGSDPNKDVKNVTIAHDVVDGELKNMLPYYTVGIEGYYSDIEDFVKNSKTQADVTPESGLKAVDKSTDNLIKVTLSPDSLEKLEPYGEYVQYKDVISGNTNGGTGSPYSISTSYRYYQTIEYLSTVTLNMEPEVLGSIEIVKRDANDETKALKGAKFKVYSDAKCTKEALHYVGGEFVTVGEVATGDDGTVRVEGLLPGEYHVVETEAPKGYIIDSTAPKTVTVDEISVDLYLTGGEGTTATIDADDITFTCTWDDYGSINGKRQQLPFIKGSETTYTDASVYGGDVFIRNGGKTVAVAAAEGSDLDAVSFAGLTSIGDAKFNVSVGKISKDYATLEEAVRYVNEELIGKGVIDSKDARNHVTITLTGENPVFTTKGASDVKSVVFTDTATIDFTVNKSWINETTPQRGEYLNVQLYQILEGTEDPGTPYGEPVQLTEENGWSYTWKGLPSGGYIYEVREPEVPVSYVLIGVKYTEGETEDGRTLITADMTNSQEVDVVVNKSWKNATPAQIGEYLEVQLFCDGEPFGDPVELNEENAWSFKWEHLEGGHRYEVDEPEIPEGFVKKVADPQTGKDKDGRILITCNITNEHVDEAPSTFDNTTMLLILGGTMLLMAAFLIIKIRKTPTK